MRILENHLLEMATLGRTASNYCIVIYTNDPGNIPHFHYVDAATRGQCFHACIRLDCCEYFSHTGKEDKLRSGQRKELVRFLQQPHDRYPQETNWQHLLYLWNNENNSDVQISEDSIMPDYTQLSLN